MPSALQGPVREERGDTDLGHRPGPGGAAVCVGKEDFASVNVMRRVTAAYKEVFLPSW